MFYIFCYKTVSLSDQSNERNESISPFLYNLTTSHKNTVLFLRLKILYYFNKNQKRMQRISWTFTTDVSTFMSTSL